MPLLDSSETSRLWNPAPICRGGCNKKLLLVLEGYCELDVGGGISFSRGACLPPFRTWLHAYCMLIAYILHIQRGACLPPFDASRGRRGPHPDFTHTCACHAAHTLSIPASASQHVPLCHHPHALVLRFESSPLLSPPSQTHTSSPSPTPPHHTTSPHPPTGGLSAPTPRASAEGASLPCAPQLESVSYTRASRARRPRHLW